MRSTLILMGMGTMVYTISAAPVVSPRQDPTPTKPMMSIGWIAYPYQPGKSTPQPERYGPRDVVLPGDDYPVPCMGPPEFCDPYDQVFVCEPGMDCYEIGPCNGPPKMNPFGGHGEGGVCPDNSMCCGHKFPWGKDHYDGPAFVCKPGMDCFHATRNAPIVPDKLVSKIANAIDVDAGMLEHEVQATAEEGTAFAHAAIDKLKHEAAKAISAEPVVMVHGAPHALGQDVEAKADAAIGELEEKVASKGKAVEKAMANVAPGVVVGAENDIEAKAHSSIKKLAPEIEAMEAHRAAILEGAEAKLQAAGLEAF
ncbi:hypothetical protein LTR27_011486 [Elasticomyces elasticus]|nr:hypothetical protein LTR27_011486 [Elasticomyces elasticus]